MNVPIDRALALLSECTGDHIWSVEHCRLRRVPQAWIDQLCDTFESGYNDNSQTIYVDASRPSEPGFERATNQYRGVRDVDLAIEVARSLGIPVEPILDSSLNRRTVVSKIKDAVMEE